MGRPDNSLGDENEHSTGELAVAPDANGVLLCPQLYTIRRAVRAGERRNVGPPIKMYVWNINKLKSNLVARPLTEREQLPYVVVTAMLWSACLFVQIDLSNVWNVLSVAWSVVLAAVGTIYLYRQNGGASGSHFLQRYFAIGFVAVVRWLAITLAAGLILLIVVALMSSVPEDTTWQEVLFFGFFELLVYWRIGCHIRDVASKARPSD